MVEVEKDEAREYRISMEVIVDAYGAVEQAMGWYYYLDDKITFPFLARCSRTVAISPLREGEQVTAVRMAPEDECLGEMFVEINWQERIYCVPLAQLLPLDVDEQTKEAVEDWHYWTARGCRLQG